MFAGNDDSGLVAPKIDPTKSWTVGANCPQCAGPTEMTFEIDAHAYPSPVRIDDRHIFCPFATKGLQNAIITVRPDMEVQPELEADEQYC